MTVLPDASTDRGQAALIARSHALDDFELLRTASLRATRAHSRLLADALHAVQHGRTDVAVEFLQRTLDALRLDELRLADAEPCGGHCCTVSTDRGQ